MNDLFADLTRLIEPLQHHILPLGLLFCRVGAMAALIPAVGEQSLPNRVKLAFALAVTAIVYPAVSLPEASEPWMLGGEVVIGLCLGFGLRVVIFTLQTAGMIAAQSMSLAQMFAGAGGEPQPIFGNMLIVAALALFVVSGGLMQVVELVIKSYELIPMGALPIAADMAAWGVTRISAVFAQAFVLAAPFVLAGLLYNLALGAINRAMPSLMVTLIGAPALTWGGLVLMTLTAPLLMQVWHAAMIAVLAEPFAE